jgi:hypothetical protein
LFEREQHLYISLIEDTELIKTDAVCDGQNVFVEVKQMNNGYRTVLVTTEIPEPRLVFSIDFHASLAAITVSFIDVQTREFAILKVERFHLTGNRRQTGIFLSGSVDSVQLDDQELDAVHPAVFVGRPRLGVPFLKAELIMPVGVPFFSTISYASVRFQRMDIELDSAFLSNLYYIATALFKPTTATLSASTPQGPDGLGLSRLFSINWLEMSPIHATLKYNRSSGRPSMGRDIFPYLKYVPSLQGSLLLPGVLVTQVTDSSGFIYMKILAEYQTAAFHQIIELLGGSGRLMSTFGVTALIAQGLGIKLTSELSSEVAQFSRNDYENFDNRKEIHGCFSQQSLSSIKKKLTASRMMESEIVTGLLAGKDIGVKLKASGKGVFGLISKWSEVDERPVKAHLRKRVPRAFLDNYIGQFNPHMSEAQSLLQKADRNEKIRMAASTKSDVVCCTDRYVFVLNREFTQVRAQMPIINLEVHQQQSDGAWSVLLTATAEKKETLTVQCQNQLHAERIRTYLVSQRKMIEIFGTSLI